MHIETCPRCDGKGIVEICEKCHGLGFTSKIECIGESISYTTIKCNCDSKITIENKCSRCNGIGTITVSASQGYPKDHPSELIPIGSQI